MICTICIDREQITLLNGKTTDLDWYYSRYGWKLKLLIRDFLFMLFVSLTRECDVVKAKNLMVILDLSTVRETNMIWIRNGIPKLVNRVNGANLTLHEGHSFLTG